MEPWGWIMVYLVGFTLFQLLLFRYFSNGRAVGGLSMESGETTGPRSADSGRTARDSIPGSGPDDDAGSVRCPHCGTDNADEQYVTYCRNCLSQLR